MANLTEIIRTHHAAILDCWSREAHRAAATRGLDGPDFTNTIPAYLSALADAQEELGKFTGERRDHVERHFSIRLRRGFPLAEMVEEFAIVGRSIAATWGPDGPADPPEHHEIENLFQELHLTSAAVTQMFTDHMLRDEQAEKQYLRLIQSVAREALQPDAPALLARLKDVLELVMEAMGAQSTALLLYSAASEKLELAASVGAADEELERYVTTLSPTSFAGRVAAQEEATSVADVQTTDLEVSDTLRQSGIHALVGVRLPPRHRLLGVLYVGLAEQRPFTVREIRRLESLGEWLTLHLGNASLHRDLRETITRLESERELRERFVSVLTHDLRGPLSAAKISAQLLIKRPERLDQRRELALKIEQNIDRTDRMIRDLLDANRLRAGHRLPLRVQECDLGALATEVKDELNATFGERFVLEAEDRVVGFWSPDELRRAVWNLATNAVKYGANDGEITLKVRRSGSGAQALVHNWGTRISSDDQRNLFQPFSRTHSAQTGGQKGWGLGLTLVHGCAEAHGGRVEVESSEELGTTFTLELPLDARPFQEQLDEPSVRA